MLNIGNIDLTKQYPSAEAEIKDLKRYIHQLVDELQFRSNLKPECDYVETDPTVPDWAKAPLKPVYTPDEVGAIAKTGDTMTGLLTLKQNAYKSSGGGLDLNNSDVVNFNGFFANDVANSANEGLNFYRDGTNWDGLYAKNGVLYFAPNHDGTTTNDKEVVHEGNIDDYLCFPKGTHNIGTVGNGYTTTTSGTVYVFLDLQKNLPSGATLTLNSLTGVFIRGVNGLIINNETVSSNVSIARQAGSGKLRLYFTGQTTNWKASSPVSFVGTINFTIS